MANAYLHYVIDLWTQQWRQSHATGDMIIVRHADDCVLDLSMSLTTQCLRTRGRALGAFRYHVSVLWKRTLAPLRQIAQLTWERRAKLAEVPQPKSPISLTQAGFHVSCAANRRSQNSGSETVRLL
jgi:hypothetical protein